MGGLIGTGFLLVLIIAFIMVFLHFVPVGLWISAMAASRSAIKSQFTACSGNRPVCLKPVGRTMKVRPL